MANPEIPVAMTVTRMQARTISALAFRARVSLGGHLTPMQQSYADTLREIERTAKAASTREITT
jgi:hypothetical protein